MEGAKKILSDLKAEKHKLDVANEKQAELEQFARWVEPRCKCKIVRLPKDYKMPYVVVRGEEIVGAAILAIEENMNKVFGVPILDYNAAIMWHQHTSADFLIFLRDPSGVWCYKHDKAHGFDIKVYLRGEELCANIPRKFFKKL